MVSTFYVWTTDLNPRVFGETLFLNDKPYHLGLRDFGKPPEQRSRTIPACLVPANQTNATKDPVTGGELHIACTFPPEYHDQIRKEIRRLCYENPEKVVFDGF